WPRGRQELNVLIVPDLRRDHDLAILIDKVRAVLRQHPATDRPVPDEWLHLTVQPINHKLGRAPIGAAARARLIDKLSVVFSTLPAFSLQLGSVLAYNPGAV